MVRLHSAGGRWKKQIPQHTKKISSQSLLIKKSNKMHTKLHTETQDGE